MYAMQFVQHYYQVHNQTFIGWAERCYIFVVWT